MAGRWSTYCAGLAAFALVGCSTYRDIRDWWTEDLRGARDGGTAGGEGAYRLEYTALPARERAPPENEDLAGGEDVAREGPRPTQRIEQSWVPPLPPAAAAPAAVRSQPAQGSSRAPPAPGRAERAAAPPAPPPAPPEPPAVADPAPAQDVPIVPASIVSVAGMSEARVREALGAPSATSERASQKIWRYAGNGCSVEIVFFLDVTRNAYAALDHKTLAGDRSASPTPCLRSAFPQDPSG